MSNKQLGWLMWALAMLAIPSGAAFIVIVVAAVFMLFGSDKK